jgi:hypothetical protein
VDEALAASRPMLERGQLRALLEDDRRLGDLRDRLEEFSDGLTTRYGTRMHEAMLASARDRAQAAQLFRSATAENPDFAAASFRDQYAFTYFDEGSIEAAGAQIAERRTALAADHELLSEPRQGRQEGALLLFSCDPAYFASHFPYWASAVQYLHNLNIKLHFVLIGDSGRVAELVEKSTEVARSLARLRGGDATLAVDRVSFSRVAVPESVNMPQTFYACARYLLARELRQRVDGQVVILDIDMMLRADPAPFIGRLRDLMGSRLSTATAPGLASLIPARRHLAGVFPVPEGELGERVMQDLEDYIHLGLSSPISWTLDQNAITYAVERAVERHGLGVSLSTHEIGQPFAQWAPAKGLFVAEQRKLEG